jgi:hypothetical protein
MASNSLSGMVKVPTGRPFDLEVFTWK